MADILIPIRFDLDGADESSADIKALRKQFADFRKEAEQASIKRSFDSRSVDETRERFALLSDEIGVTRQEAKQLSAAIDNLSTEIKTTDTSGVEQLTTALKESEAQAKQTTDAIEKISTARPRVDNGRGFDAAQSAGDASTGFSAAGSAIRGLGLGGVGGKIADFGDLLGFVEQAPKLAGGFSAMLASATPLIGVTAGVAIGAAVMGKALKDSGEEIKKLAKAQQDQVDAAIKTREDLRNLSVEQARQQIADLEFSIQTNQAALDSFAETADESIRNVDDVGDSIKTSFSLLAFKLGQTTGNVGEALAEITRYNDLIGEQEAELARLNEQVLQAIQLDEMRSRAAEIGAGDAERFASLQAEERDRQLQIQSQIASGTTESANQQLEELKRKQAGDQAYFENLQARYDELNAAISAITPEEFGTDAGKLKIEALAGELQALAPILQEARDAVDQNVQSIGDLTNTIIPQISARERELSAIEAEKLALEELSARREQIVDSLRSVNDQIKAFAQDESAKQKLKAQEDAIKSARAAEDDLLESRFKQAVAARDAQQATEKVIAIEQDRNEKIQSINTKFMEQSQKRLAETLVKERRIQEDANRDRIRLLEDLQADLFEASAGNDVNAFITRLRAGNKELTRGADDEATADQRRAEDTARANEEAIQARSREIEATIEAANEKLSVERQGHSQSLTLEQQYQQERARIQVQRQIEDQQRQADIQRSASNQRLQALQAEAIALQRQLMEVDRAATRNAAVIGANVANSFLSNAMAIASGANKPKAIGNAFNPGSTKPLISFDDGGIVTRDTLALLHKDEWVIPMRPSNGIGADMAARGLGGAPVFNIDFSNANLGALSEGQVTGMFQQFATTIVQGMADGRKQAGV